MDRTIGFIVVDEEGVLYGKLEGGNRETIHKFTKQYWKYSIRCSEFTWKRLRIEWDKRFIQQITDNASRYFISNESVNNESVKVDHIVLATTPDMKYKLCFDERITDIIECTIEVSHGGEAGFEEAIKSY